jgi:polyisoprenoid-binding protein YceI
MSRRRWLIAVPVAVLLVVVGGPWLYINVIRDDPPERLGFDDLTTTTTAPAPDDGGSSSTTAAAQGGIEGIWSVAAGSQAGYRVKEVLFGQDAEAVGRTEGVTGTLEISGTTVTAAEVEVDMASVTSDQSRRDDQFRGRIMSTSEFPTATFTLTEPIGLRAVPAEGDQVAVSATGELTLRGVTREVILDLSARLVAGRIEVSGSILVDFDEFQIPDASGGPASVGRDGELELLLAFAR